MLKIYGNDHVVAKSGCWFEILIFIGGYGIASVVLLFVIVFLWALIVDIAHSIGAISNSPGIVDSCCDYYLWILLQLWLLLWYNRDSCIFDSINNWILP